MPMIDQNKMTARRAPWLLLGSALALRLVLALVTEGYPYDMSCFVAWGEKLAAQGPANFYSEGYFADYPPGYLPVLGLVALLRGALSLSYESPLTYLLLALAPALCDAAAAWLVWRVAAHSMPRSPALLLTAFTAFNPLTLFDTGVWKQIDGAFALPLLLCFLLLEQRRYLPAAFLYGVALAIKPQALLFGPVLAACFLAAIVQQTDRFRALGRCFGGAALALLPPLAMGLPFFGIRDLIPSLLEKYSGTMSGYPYASINAFNWIAAMGGNWQPLENEALFGVSWHTVGWFMILAVTGGLVFFAVRSVNNGSFSPLLLAAYYGLGVFTFGHCMHERYMLPGVLLVLLAAARWHDVRLYAAGFGLSLTGFLNLATVYSLAGTEDEWLTSATSSSFAVLVGLGETVCFLLLLFAVWDLALHGHALPLPARPLYREADAPAAQPAWRRGEVLALLALTAATAALSFACLGDTDAPQNPLDATDTVLSETVTAESSAVWLWAYPGVSFGGSLKVTDEQGQVLLTQELGYTTCFSWSESRLPVEAGQTLTITVENAQMFELSFRNGDGDAVPVTGGGALFDEQDAVPDTISQLNSMYFDEIYHARTAYEQLHGLRIYETTHPPLGKDLIMAGVALFGMTGFGWRFSGTLFGVLLVPLAWCFARRLTRKRWLGAVAGALLALDFMRFVQSRIATIDIYGTFFILLGAYFMLWYCQSVLQKGVTRSLLPMALGGVVFGLGCAAKWTGLYAGAGLAVLYLGVLYARWRQGRPGFRAEFRAAAIGGVAFYILAPLCIYLASYLPYRWQDAGFGLADWWQCQVSMFQYHSGLEATHPFESRWYTWLLGLRPVWYYQNTHLADGLKASIAGLGGPVIWLAGLACLLALLWHQVSNRGSRAGAGVLILYGAQLVPWMLVTRCTFLYHYFPSSMFCLAAIVLVLSHLRSGRLARRIGVGLCAVSLVLFLLYYPALSGLPVPAAWASALEILPSFGFY